MAMERHSQVVFSKQRSKLISDSGNNGKPVPVQKLPVGAESHDGDILVIEAKQGHWTTTVE